MNIKTTLKYAEPPNLDDLYVVKKANDWMRQTRSMPVPKMLFGGFWLEGELSVLTGAAGTGKSLLAVQIAESIARSRPIEPLQINAASQSVLYLDLKLSEKQFEMRYSQEYDAADGDLLKKPYKFSDKFQRIEIDICKPLPAGFRSFDEVLPRIIEQLVRKIHSKVVIIDDITCLQSSVYGYRETPAIMKELRRLRHELGISILVLADSPRSTRLLGRFADNVFTIGQSKLDPGARYIKHIIAHSTEMMYDASHVPSFRITRLKGNFLGFEHQAFSPESVHLQDVRDREDWPVIQTIKAKADDGDSIREIAAELGFSKTSVHRMLQMWTPNQTKTGAAAKLKEYDPTTSEFYFPGCEEYDKEFDDPRFENMFSEETPEDRALRREYGNIELARYEAHNEYEATGKAPTLAAMIARVTEPEALEDSDIISGRIAGADAAQPPDEHDGVAAEPYFDEAGQAEPFCLSSGQSLNATSGLKRSLDAYGKEIFVEKEAANGKPMVWYNFDSKGRKKRWERKGNAIIGSVA